MPLAIWAGLQVITQSAEQRSCSKFQHWDLPRSASSKARSFVKRAASSSSSSDTQAPNNALQRTAHGGRPFSVFHVLPRHEPSLSLGPLGGSSSHIPSMKKPSRSLIGIIFGSLILALGFWLSCQGTNLWITYPNGVPTAPYAGQIETLAQVLMYAGTALSVFATVVWMRSSSSHQIPPSAA